MTGTLKDTDSKGVDMVLQVNLGQKFAPGMKLLIKLAILKRVPEASKKST